jgi:hypothetical protein
MARKRYKAGEIVAKLRQVDVLTSNRNLALFSKSRKVCRGAQRDGRRCRSRSRQHWHGAAGQTQQPAGLRAVVGAACRCDAAQGFYAGRGRHDRWRQLHADFSCRGWLNAWHHRLFMKDSLGFARWQGRRAGAGGAWRERFCRPLDKSPLWPGLLHGERSAL